jgi:transcription-repair coupling factor (superfamily II helicase)
VNDVTNSSASTGSIVNLSGMRRIVRQQVMSAAEKRLSRQPTTFQMATLQFQTHMEPASAAASAPARVSAAERLRELAAHLNLHRGFADVIASLEAGHGGTLGGVWGSSRALVAAALVRSCPGPLVVVAPHPGEIDSIARDLALFSNLPVAEFPAWESEPGERVVHDEIYGERLRVLKELGAGSWEQRGRSPETLRPPLSAPHTSILVTSIQSLLQPVPSRDVFAAATREIRVGAQLDEQEFTRWLAERGGHATTAVELPGEFSMRGGILDIFPPDADDPVRIELFGNDVESIRRFDVGSQRSLATLDSTSITMLEPTASDRAHFTGYLPQGTWFLLIEPSELAEEGKFYLDRMDRPQAFHAVRPTLEEIYKFPSVTASGVPAGSMETTAHLEFESVERFSGEIGKVRDELDKVSEGHEVFLVCETEAEAERLKELFKSSKLMGGDCPLFLPEGAVERQRATQEKGTVPLNQENEERDIPFFSDTAESAAKRVNGKKGTVPRLHFVVGHLEAGFRIVPQRVVLVSAAELFQRQDLARTTRRRQARAIDSFLELREGDLVVHVAHGIGRYRGLRLLEQDGRSEEHLELEYHGGTKIYVPSAKIELVQKYVGGTRGRPVLAHIGGKAWVRQKEAAQRAVTDLAAEMIELQAARDARPGIAFPPDSEWQREFDAAFPYQETPDQISAIAEIKSDMQAARPMDRLLCGDVGFGKTELAIRAAFKAVDAGHQVAVLVPTTVLAEQHRRTFAARMAEFPFQIASISRFNTAKEQRQIIEQTAAGQIDILIGTHRIASPDVQFANLGLLVIDEEQRFGVEIKERLKALRTTVDVLTMTATPIPRTLHMSLLGVRAISNLETPPADRLAVETRVTRFSDELVRHAIMRELNRSGQIYFVHNRINDIRRVAMRLAEIVPEAQIDIGHGQMPEHELEDVMLRFVRGETDILLSTTIVESGLDIPNANTIFIDDADRYGLADLHQLRGRVGRYKHRAYCYLLVDENRHLSPEAARRLRAIEEFSQMGAGFALAMRDLELRGAGNILGTQQSGHIATVGYELYCALLERAVRRLKRLPQPESVEVSIDLPGEAYLPRGYVPDMRAKVDLYRRLARLTTEAAVDDFATELVDRFGPLPNPVSHLLELARLRIYAHVWGVQEIRLEDRYAVLAYSSREKLEPLVKRTGGRLRVADERSAYLLLSVPLTSGPDVFAEIKSLLQPVGRAA